MEMTTKMLVSLASLALVSLMVHLLDMVLWKPERLRSKLRKQGIRGPPPSFLLGNLREIMRCRSPETTTTTVAPHQLLTHRCSSILFPFFHRWTLDYGPVFMFSLGSIQILYVNQPELVKEITICTSLDLGKPSYQQEEHGPLLGQGILTSNGPLWVHQRKILAPEFYTDKVKAMVNTMTESAVALVNSWKNKLEIEGPIADIKIDESLRSFSGDVISRSCFGSSYSKGEEIFLKLRALEEVISKKNLASGIPGLRYVPTKSNKEIWRLEKEIRSLILAVVKQRVESTSDEPEEDLLQIILRGAQNSNLRPDAADRFIVDNCKNIYLAGYETTAVAATWTLMLLASHQEWQARVRAEVLQVCAGQLPDSDMLRKMKLLTMVIHESLRLYPPVFVMSREALQDIQLGNLQIPKGVNLWTLVVALHQDPEYWGPDADKFNPDRFANGVAGACKLPHLYMPFGVGPRVCLGQTFAMTELKILLALILSNFSFTLSPNYRHSPVLRLVIEPEHGVDILINKL